jgi:hypothetical protein
MVESMTYSAPSLPLPRFFLDFETTGLNPATAQVIEVALRGATHLDRLISNAPPSTPEALKVHGITPWLCQRKGRPSKEVLAELIEALGPGPVEIVAHNAAFEQGFLEAWAQRGGMALPEIRWTCTLAWSRRLMPRAPINHQLGSLVTSLGWQVEGLHRAAADTEFTVRLTETLEAWERVKEALGPDPGVIYLAGPLRGDGSSAAIVHNQVTMAIMAKWAQAVFPSATLLIPHLNFAYVDETGEKDQVARSQVLRSCERLVARSDALILCGSPTEGMERERRMAAFMKLPVFSVPGWDEPAPKSVAVTAAQAG